MQSEQFQLHADIEQRHWWFLGPAADHAAVGRPSCCPLRRTTTIIDVGCGTGGNIGCLADQYRAIGIDTSAEAIERAAAAVPQSSVSPRQGPADLGPLMREARLITLMDVLEHVQDDFALLSELLAAAEPGTYFLLTVPADESLWTVHDESFGHYRRYDAARLEKTWGGLPVTPMLVSYFNSRLLPLVRLVRGGTAAASRRPGRRAPISGCPSGRSTACCKESWPANRGGCCKCWKAGRQAGYASGASLVAILRRERGTCEVRPKPAGLRPDHLPG